MTFSGQIRHNRLFQQVIHKVGESEINFFKRFQNSKALTISVGTSYSEDQLMHNFLDNFQQGGKFNSQTASQKEELRTEEYMLIKNNYQYLT